MKIGFVGLGKLGYPCALAIESKGHEVIGYDPSAVVDGYVNRKNFPYTEEGLKTLEENSKIRSAPLHEVLDTDLIFVAVQTPHDPQYDGCQPIPDTRRDFNYFWLSQALENLSAHAPEHGPRPRVVVISTVLPGTMHRLLTPRIRRRLEVFYNPYFIAMGTVIRDFLNPEFVLVGEPPGSDIRPLVKFYRSITDAPILNMSVESAELAKVAYNTFIGMKIVFANTMMEVCAKTAANVDDVLDVIKHANRRLISTAYLSAGMGDGGGCHPRDNIAMSWLARELKLSHDIFTDLMKAREDQTDWLADVIVKHHRETGLPIVILGTAFKAETDLMDGSPALLLNTLLRRRGYAFSHYGREDGMRYLERQDPAVYFIATPHPEWKRAVFPANSRVLDPWNLFNDPKGGCYYPIGR